MNEADKKNAIKTARKELKAFYEMNTDAECAGIGSAQHFGKVIKGEATLKERSPMALNVAIKIYQTIREAAPYIDRDCDSLYLKCRVAIANSIFDALEKAIES